MCRMAEARERMTQVDTTVRKGGGGRSGFEGGGETKQDVLNDVCDLLNIPRQDVARGSSLPSEVFQIAARRAGVPGGTMPEVCEAVIKKAGMIYSPGYDSRATLSGGGSTVTLEGIQALRTALGKLGS